MKTAATSINLFLGFIPLNKNYFLNLQMIEHLFFSALDYSISPDKIENAFWLSFSTAANLLLYESVWGTVVV